MVKVQVMANALSEATHLAQNALSYLVNTKQLPSHLIIWDYNEPNFE